MSRNMSMLDRRVRSIVVAPAAIVIAIVIGAGSTLGVVLFAIAAVMLATSAIGFCPLYRLLHLEGRMRGPLPH